MTPDTVDMFGHKPTASGILARRFGAPPFSVLSARDGDWQDRKRAWLALGIQSEVGRGGSYTNGSINAMQYAGGFKERHGFTAAPGGGADAER